MVSRSHHAWAASRPEYLITSPEDGTPDNYQEKQTKGKGDEIFVFVSVHYLIYLS